MMPNQSKPTHLSLSERKTFICRFLAFLTYEDHESSDVSNRLEVVRDHILTIADQEHDRFDDTQLDKWLGEVAQRLRDALPVLGVAEPTLIMRKMAVDFEKQCQQVRCKSCVAKTNGGKICNGSLRDANTVDAAGDCIKFIRTLFDAAHEISEAYYGAFANALDIRSVEVRFSTEIPPPEKLQKMPPEYAVDGVTALEDNGPFAISAVKLFLNVKNFDWPTYLATFYVLLHELICHAFVALSTKTKRPSSVDYDSYAEGWMDYVVNIVLGDLEANVGPASAVGRSLPSISMYGVGQRFHNYRSSPAIANAALKQGVKAARGAYDALQEILPPEKARAAMLQLSFSLNSLSFSDFSVEQRVDLTQILARRLDRKVPKHNPKKAKMIRIFKDFSGHGDARKFCQALRSA